MRLNSFILFITVLLTASCVDRVDFEIQDNGDGILVVEGFVSDAPGPYTVKLSRSFNADDNLFFGNPVVAKKVELFDGEGNSVILDPVEIGTYQSDSNGFRGEIGKKYHLMIELFDGKIFESSPDELTNGGQIENVTYEFVKTPQQTGPTKYGFKVFVNANSNNNPYIRWKFTGIYKFLTYPELHRIGGTCPPNIRGADPLPCSLEEGGCKCCLCWVSDYESKPHLSSREIVTNGDYKNVEVGYVPFDEITFAMGKYMVRVEQMSLSQQAYDYFNVIKDQKEGSNSLFQPSFGKVGTNFMAINSTAEVIGVFYATSISSKAVFINAKDAPISVPSPTFEFFTNCFFWDACNKVFPNASTTPPPEWE